MTWLNCLNEGEMLVGILDWCNRSYYVASSLIIILSCSIVYWMHMIWPYRWTLSVLLVWISACKCWSCVFHEIVGLANDCLTFDSRCMLDLNWLIYRYVPRIVLFVVWKLITTGYIILWNLLFDIWRLVWTMFGCFAMARMLLLLVCISKQLFIRCLTLALTFPC